MVSAAHPPSNTYLVRRVPSGEPGDFLEMEAGKDADPLLAGRMVPGEAEAEAEAEGKGEGEAWRLQPLAPPPPPNAPGAFLPVDERANLYGGPQGSGVVGIMLPPADFGSRGDGRGGLERAPWEEPRSEMVLARRRGAWVHRCRLQFRGEPVGGFLTRLLSAQGSMEQSHRKLALQLASECMPEDPRVALPERLVMGVAERVQAWQAAPCWAHIAVVDAAGGSSDGDGHWAVRRTPARSADGTRRELLAEVALDFSTAMRRVQLVHAVSHAPKPSPATIFLPHEVRPGARHAQVAEALRRMGVEDPGGAMGRLDPTTSAVGEAGSAGEEPAQTPTAAPTLQLQPTVASATESTVVDADSEGRSQDEGSSRAPGPECKLADASSASLVGDQSAGTTDGANGAAAAAAAAAAPAAPAAPPAAATATANLPVSLPVAPPPPTLTDARTASGVRSVELFLRREGSVKRPHPGGARPVSFTAVPPVPAPPTNWMEVQRTSRLDAAQKALSHAVARERLESGERVAMLGALQLMEQAELLPRPPPKPGPPTPIAERLISFGRAATQVTHLGCIHLATDVGDSKLEHGRWVCAFAAQAGDLEALRWMRTHGIQWDALTPAKAAENGHLKVLKYVRSCGCPWDELTMAAAASRGWLDCLRYCHEHGCPWDFRLTDWAVTNGHVDAFKWALGVHAPLRDQTKARGDSLVRAARIWADER